MNTKPMLASDFVKYVSSLPDADDIIEGILPKGETALFCGAPYSCKSLEVQRLTCQFPVGGDYHGLKVKMCDAAYLTWEGSQKGLANRFSRFIQGVPLVKNPVMWKLDEQTPLNTKEGYKLFLEVVKQIRAIRNATVLVIDSFPYTIRGDHKSDVTVGAWWEAVQKLSNTQGITCIFVWEFTKPIIFRGDVVNPYGLERLKSAYQTAYKVNTVIGMGEWSKTIRLGKSIERIRSPQIVGMKVKDGATLPPLNVTLDTKTLCLNGEYWKFDEETQAYIVIKDGKNE